MNLTCYLGQPHERQAEEIAARSLAAGLRRCLGPGEWARAAFNFRFWRNCQVDALVVTPQAVIVADWKDGLGAITGGEDGPWLRNGQPIAAGSASNENPYHQILRIRRTVSAFIRKSAAHYFHDGGRRFGVEVYRQVSAAIVFTPTDPEKHLSLPSTTRSWLLVTGLDVVAEQLTARRSLLRLQPTEAEALVTQGWHCRPWEGLDALLQEQAVGHLWHVRPDGTREGRAVSRSFSIGRGAGSDWVLTAASDARCQEGNGVALVSRRHLQVDIVGGQVVVYDLGTTNGTYLDANSLARHHTLPTPEPLPIGRAGRLEPAQALTLMPGDELSLGGPAGQACTARLQFVAGQPTGTNNPTANRPTETAL
jgi:hypothetical protein